MAELPATILEQLRGLRGLEGVAVASAIAYLVLAIRQNIGCWIFAGISTAIFAYLFINARLYMESALNVFYFAMAVYGWSMWKHAGSGDDNLAVISWPVRRHAIAIAAVVVMSGVSGYILTGHTDAEFPYVDSLTTWGAVWATFLVARKILENWWYWFVIDAASIFIYWSRELELTALLFIAYVVMIPFGFLGWKRSMSAQPAT